MARYELLSPEGSTQEQPSTLGSAIRNILRTDVRIGESLLGTPGDIEQGILALGNLASEKLIGKRPLPEKITPLPTTQQVRGFTQEVGKKLLPEGYLEPQTPTEKGVDEFISDLTAILHPIGGPVSKARAIAGVGSAGLGHLAKWGSEVAGLGEKGAEGVKVGTMLLTSLAGSPSLSKIAKKSYEIADEFVPAVHLDARKLLPSLRKIEKSVLKGAVTPSKEFLKDRARELLTTITKNKGKIPADEAYQYIKDFNEFFREGSVPAVAQGVTGQIIDGLKNILGQTKTTHPQFYNAFKEGSDIYKTINTSSKANEFAQNIIGKLKRKIHSPFTAYFFGLPKAAALSGAGKALEFSANALDRALRSTNIQKTYAKAIASALKKQAGPLARHITHLDKELTKIEPEKTTQKRYVLLGR